MQAEPEPATRDGSTPPFYMVPKQAHDQILRGVEGTDATYCLTVYVAARKLANDKGKRDGPLSLTINEIAATAGCGYRKAADALKVLKSIGVIKITSQHIPGTEANAPSIYTFPTLGTMDTTLGAVDLTLGTEQGVSRAEINKEQKEQKETCTLPAAPAGKIALKTPKHWSNDPLLATLAAIDGDPTQAPASAWSGYGKIRRELLEVYSDLSAAEINRRLANYRLHFPTISPTAHGLHKHWAKADKSPTTTTRKDPTFRIITK